MSGRRARDDCGAATVLALALVVVLVFVAAVCVGSVGIVLTHRRAQAAADLAALAAAAALQRGAAACQEAARVAGRQRAVVTSCSVRGAEVLVVTAMDLPSALGGATVAARARAGPQDAVGGAGLTGRR